MKFSLPCALAACFVIGAGHDAFAQASQSTDSDPAKVEQSAEDSEASRRKQDSRGVDLEEIVVTGVGGGRRKSQLKSSVSVSDLSVDEVKDFAPRSTAEIFRNIPGIRSESSGGDNNANIQVRGLPVSTGGGKFVQLQEDGLPVIAFGDITFGNADNFLRYDTTVLRVEALRGGSASTFTSGAPGAIINFISRTGEVQGGEVGLTRGLDFDSTRVDLQYGSPIFEDWLFHIGGFFRIGEGPRDSGYLANNGGQLKANLTRKFENGYVRVYYKHLNDRAAAYLPGPVRLDDGAPRAVGDYDGRRDTLASRHLRTNVRINSNGELESKDLSDGSHALTNAIGLEADFDLGSGWKVVNRGRYSNNSGGYAGAFAANYFENGAAALDGLGGSSLVYANGPSAGQAFMTGDLVSTLLFDVAVNDLSHFVNDLRVSKTFETGIGTFDVTAGYYKSVQEVETEWSFNTYLQEARGENGALVDVLDADGTPLSVNGITTFAGFDPLFDLTFNRDAIFGAVSYSGSRFSIDASVRYDMFRGTGSTNLDGMGGNNNATLNSDDNDDGAVTGSEIDLDVNGDGRVAAAEQNISAVDRSNLFDIDFAAQYVSYSFGANVEILDGLAAFIRYSQGSANNGDRQVLGNQGFSRSGRIDEGRLVDTVNQLEVGVKFQSGNRIPGRLALFLTGFLADSEETNFDVTTGMQFDREVRGLGAELEASYRLGPLSVVGGLTLTNAEITSDSLNPDNEGNTPQRQAVAVYQLTTAWSDYLFDRFYSLGFNVVGTTDSFTADVNDLKQPGFAQFNAFVNVELLEDMILSFNANNLFNTFGITEVGNASLPANGIVNARAINGRTMSMSLRYQF